MRHITIQECYDSITICETLEKNTITHKEADELYNYILAENLDKDYIVWGRDTVTFINYVGYIKLSTVAIEILPKVSINRNQPEFGRKALLNLLSKSGILDVTYSDLASLHIYKIDLNEIITLLFARKLQKELTRGPYQEYVYIEENSSALKGSLLVKEHIRNIASQTSKVFCRYEEFSMDNTLNRIFNYCVKISLKNIKNEETIKLLQHSQSYFADLKEVEISNYEIVNYKFNRLNSRFEQVFILAKMILMGYSSIGSSGVEKTYSILFKMNEVFEKYITRLLSMNLEDSIVKYQHSKYRLLVNEDTNNSIFKLEPDIVIESNGIESIIIDTKWKRISSEYNRHGVKREDLYQMYAYLTRYPDVDTVILLYPHNENVETEDKKYLESWYLDYDKSKKIRGYTVDLESEELTVRCLKEIVRDVE
ncbi:McrC family protein [Clostridium sp. C8-1-8]|uniref:McrC family protein n=1 Tax=Clostridium sp. C8-1-8 TaxID=2698831 RepID=UPI001369385F|nr:McrC family protein [Clostridium sp. C8-1-8]